MSDANSLLKGTEYFITENYKSVRPEDSRLFIDNRLFLLCTEETVEAALRPNFWIVKEESDIIRVYLDEEFAKLVDNQDRYSKCDICKNKLTEAEKRQCSVFDFNITCEKHKEFKVVFQLNAARAIAGFDEGFSDEDVKLLKDNYENEQKEDEAVILALSEQIKDKETRDKILTVLLRRGISVSTFNKFNHPEKVLNNNP